MSEGTNTRTFYITPMWSLGEVVYHKTDQIQEGYLVTGIVAYIDGSIAYQLKSGSKCETSFGEELTNNKNYLV